MADTKYAQCETVDLDNQQCYREATYMHVNRAVCWCHLQVIHDETREVSFIAPSDRLELRCVGAAE